MHEPAGLGGAKVGGQRQPPLLPGPLEGTQQVLLFAARLLALRTKASAAERWRRVLDRAEQDYNRCCSLIEI